MKFDPCKLSLIRNFADRELYLYVDGINSFVKNIDPSKISSYGGKIKNINDALYCYIYPIYKDKNNEYVRNYEFSEQALLNQSSSLPSNLATEASFYRVLGILQQNKIALTTVAAELLLTKKIFVQEYALIILSKQWIWADNNCRKNLLIALYELFTNKVNSLQFLYEAKVEKINNFSKELFLSIEGRPFNNNDDIDFSRYDILRNLLLLSGLLNYKNNNLCISQDYHSIYKALQQKESSLTKHNYGDVAYYEYLGSLDTGIFEVICKENADSFIHLYPNLVEYCLDKIELKYKVSKIPAQPRQQIFYGAPGTGKSHATNEVVENYGGTIRTTFHPDSDYSTFVGAYKPVEEECASDGNPTKKNSITYKFVKQAFTKAYLLAWKKWMDGTNSVYTTDMLTTRVPHATNKNTTNTAPFDETVIQLTQNERNAVLDIDSFGYDFSGQTSLGDIHKTIKVVITDKPSEKQLAQFQSRITKEEYDEIKNKHEELKRRVLLSQGENIGSQIDALSNLLQRYRPGESGDYFADFDCLLGLYSPAVKTVYLFMDNIRNGGKENIELLCAVYVHEMLHAYFHSDAHYVKEIEEAIVECLTLCFLKEYDYANGTNLCNEYLKHVEKKKYTPFCYYAFGKYLYENCNVDWLTEYKNKYSQIKTGSPLLKDYLNLVKLYYPFDNELNTYNSLCRIFINNIKNNIGDSNAQFLVIEEINRGNCAQIFGDIFQLLDRQDNGFSKYPIEADTDLQKAIQKAFAEEKDFMLSQDIAVDDILPNYKSAHQGTLSSDIQNGYILLLPNNLHIWATMNTSDQSLFPIDSAFKRRWAWKYVKIEEPKEDDNKMFIELEEKDGTPVQKPWIEVITTINTYIKRKLKSSDKQIGYWFVKSDCEVEVSEDSGNKKKRKGISIEQFRDKVLFFLFDDAFKDDEDFASLFGNTDYLFVDLFNEDNMKAKVFEILDKMKE